ncbi:E3 ubiquitin protein ligase DRIP2-like [Wolffia australiana]
MGWKGGAAPSVAAPGDATCSTAYLASVKRNLLLPCLTCPLCHSLFRDATTISECLHTFCRKCIYDKLTVEELDSCPTCSISLGGTPVEKLRPDHNLQDVRSKIFPFKRRKENPTEVVPSISLPVRRKERSLSSLVVNSPRVVHQIGLNHRRRRGGGRKGPGLRVLNDRESVKKEEDSEVYQETIVNIPQFIHKNDFDAEASIHDYIKDTEHIEEPSAGKSELWKPLSCLVEAAHRTKPASFIDLNPVAKVEPVNCSMFEENDSPTNKNMEHLQKRKTGCEKDDSSDIPVIGKVRRAGDPGQKRAATSRMLHYGSRAKTEREVFPLWFSLVSASDREGDAQLPQLSSSYLRIKDGTLPVLFIQKYLAKKLDLASETEVEVMCRGQEVMPSLAMRQLVDLWLQTDLTEKAETSLTVETPLTDKAAMSLDGPSAENFVMVLSYARRLPVATAAAVIATNN